MKVGSREAISGVLAAYYQSYHAGAYLFGRFQGRQETKPLLKLKTEMIAFNSMNYYAVIKRKSLHLYSNEDQKECLRIIPLSDFTIDMYPRDIPDTEMYIRTKPIHLSAKRGLRLSVAESERHYIYAPSKSDKEDWFLLLRRAIQLPEFADAEASTVFYQDLEPMQNYMNAMKTLIKNTLGSDEILNTNTTAHSVAWLNALVGRAFVAIHSNPYVNEWLTHRLSSYSIDSSTTSFLGDIQIQNISVGNSIPVLSNPKLLNLSMDQDMAVECDVEYTGGIQIEVGTIATFSVAAWDSYVKPITVPLVVAVKIKRFSAKVLIKIKPLWESNRVWFGFYRKPEVKLEIEVEPIISNKLIRLSLVNQVIEKRLKQALEEFVILPNMDDLVFWDLTGKFTSQEDLDCDETRSEGHQESIRNSTAEMDASLVGEALESSIRSKRHIFEPRPEVSPVLTDPSLPVIPLLSEEPSFVKSTSNIWGSDTDSTASESPASMNEQVKESYMDVLGNAAFKLGGFVRRHGLDNKAQVVADKIAEMSQPAVSYARDATTAYSEYVQATAVAVGMTAVDKLGLVANDPPLTNRDNSDQNLDEKSGSVVFNLMGLSLTTSAPTASNPQLEGASSPIGTLRKKSRVRASPLRPEVYSSEPLLTKNSSQNNSSE